MGRHVLAVDLKDDPQIVETYTAHHQRVWPEVLRSLREAGLEDMEIFVHGRRLVMIVETRGNAACETIFARHAASHPRVAQWEALMRSMQQPIPGAAPDEWWARMLPVFRLT